MANAAIKPTADVGVAAGVAVADAAGARAVVALHERPVCAAVIGPCPRAPGILSVVLAFITLSILFLNAAQAQKIKAPSSHAAYLRGAAVYTHSAANAAEADELVLGHHDMTRRNDLGRKANTNTNTNNNHLPDGWYARQPRDHDVPRPSFWVTMINKLLPGIIPTRSPNLNRDQSPVATRESWTGAALDQYGWSIYSGLTWAPFGHEGVGGEGWRVRLTGGRSHYRYKGAVWNAAAEAPETINYYGTSGWSDLLIGYKKQVGAVTVKGFIGAARGANSVTPNDPGAKTQGAYFGVKGALETWINLSPAVWLSTDVSYAQPHHSYSVNSRLGYRWTPAWSLGGEIAQFGNDDGAGRRLGGFARYEWDAGEISASAGLTGELFETGSPTSRRETVIYGSVNFLRRF